MDIPGWFNTTFKRETSSDVQRKAGQKPSMDEIGVSGESILGVYPDAEARVDKLQIKDYVKMRQNDGTIAALYNVLTLPVQSTPYIFEADEDDANEEQADFVRDALTSPPHKGGMDVPLDLVIADMLRATLEGFRLFERVYRLNDDGKVVYKKLATRDAETVYLVRADDGGYGGAHQRTTFRGHFVDVWIPAEKTFLFTYGKDKQFLYGESAFKSAAYHYDIKHKLYYLANLAIQVGAVPPSIITGPTGTEENVKRRLLNEAKKLGVRTTLYVPEDFTMDPYNTATGRMDALPLIEHQDNEMARSVLAQFIMLGGSVRSVGSWALSESHSDLFMMALHGAMANVENHINHYLIPDLIDLNFEKPAYPVFKFENVSPDTQALLHDAFVQLATTGQLTPAMNQGIQDQIATTLEIDVEQVQKDLDKKAADDAVKAVANAKKGLDPDGKPLPPSPVAPVIDPKTGQPVTPTPAAPKPDTVKSDVPVKATPDVPADQKKKSLADQQWRRPLTPAEQRIDFSAINSKMDGFEAELKRQVVPVITKIKDDAIARLESLLKGGDVKAIQGFTLKYTDEYRQVIASVMRQAYEYGKKGAADELGKPSPTTSRETNALINQQAGFSCDKQMNDLLFGIKAAVISATRKNTLSLNLGLGDVLVAVSNLFAGFLSNKTAQTAAVVVSMGINTGRRDVFAASKQDIAVYQYSAILDERTCPLCYGLDGSVVDYAEYMSTSYDPPLHGNCRCIWVAILSDQSEIPDTTGFPDDPGNGQEPSL